METSFNNSFLQDNGMTRRNNNLGGMKMKRLFEKIKLFIACLIVLGLEFLVTILYIHTYNDNIFISVIICMVYIIFMGTITMTAVKWYDKWYIKNKNSQKNTRE